LVPHKKKLLTHPSSPDQLGREDERRRGRRAAQGRRYQQRRDQLRWYATLTSPLPSQLAFADTLTSQTLSRPSSQTKHTPFRPIPTHTTFFETKQSLALRHEDMKHGWRFPGLVVYSVFDSWNTENELYRYCFFSVGGRQRPRSVQW